MKSQWMVCVLALLFGCSEDGGASSGAPEFGEGSAYSWFTGDAEELCSDLCASESCWPPKRCSGNFEPCEPDCAEDDVECRTADCYRLCRELLANPCSAPRWGELFQCQVDAGVCNCWPGYGDCLSGCFQGWEGSCALNERCHSCFGLDPSEDVSQQCGYDELERDENGNVLGLSPEYVTCNRSYWACMLSGGDCHADLLLESCRYEERAGRLECSIDDCFLHSTLAGNVRRADISCGN